MILPFWIQGLAFGLYYVPNDDDEDDFDVEVFGRSHARHDRLGQGDLVLGGHLGQHGISLK